MEEDVLIGVVLTLVGNETILCRGGGGGRGGRGGRSGRVGGSKERRREEGEREGGGKGRRGNEKE